MTIMDIIALAGKALSLYQSLAKAAKAQGMSPSEFDAAADKEAARLEAWLAETNKAEDDVFHSP